MSTSKLVKASQVQALISAIPKYCAGMTFMLGGTTYTAAQAVQLAESYLAAGSAKAQAKAAYEAAIVAEKTSIATEGASIRELRQILAANFSNSTTTLADLQINVRKTPKPLTVQALAVRSAKAKATRAARGTTSKKQKATISGSVTGVVITPTVAPAASSSSTTAPAPSGAAPTGATGNASPSATSGAAAPHA